MILAERARWVELGFRAATSAIFVVAGAGHLLRTERMVARVLDAPLGRSLASLIDLEPLMIASGIALLAGGLALALGFWTRRAAVVLVCVLLPITIVAHVGHGEDPGPLLKNIALLGSLAHFIAHGAGRISLDARRSP
jgi:putative oxidoreductase